MRMTKVIAGGAAATLLVVGMAAPQIGTALAVRPGSGASRDSGAAKHEMSAADLKTKLDKNQTIIIIDARADLNGQIIKGAIHVPLGKVEEWAKTADKMSVVVTYCTCPHDEAAEAEVNKLRELGFENAFALSGGLDAARKAGLEIVAPSE